MLVLSRKVDDKIFIGDEVEVMVIGIRGDRVRLGIKAPPYVPIERDDVRSTTTLAEREARKAQADG